MGHWLLISESVTEGHPDKAYDQISDAILGEILKQDKDIRVARETVANTGLISITGKIATSGHVELDKIVRQTLKEIGYGHRSGGGFSYENHVVLSAIKERSHDIAQGVDRFKEGSTDAMDVFGTGGQGMMFGYACNETEEYIPMPASLTYKLLKRLADVRKNRILDYLRPDGKTQVTLVYEDGKPVAMKNITVTAQHTPEADLEKIRWDIREHAIEPIIPTDFITEGTQYYIDATGRFVLGGPLADAGLIGREITVDTCDGYAHHGGGALLGKDPTKVDRSAAYAARYAIKSIVAAGLAGKREVGFPYVVRVVKPLSIYVKTFGTGKVSDIEIEDLVHRNFNLKPVVIIKGPDLLRPIYW